MHTVNVIFNRTGHVVYSCDHRCSQKAIKDYYKHHFKLKDHGYTVTIETAKELETI